MTMDAAERQSIATVLAELASSHDGSELDRALADFGWSDLLRLEPLLATGALFAAQGRAGTWSGAFHDLLAGWDPIGDRAMDRAVVLVPMPGSNGRRDARPAVDGLLIGPRTDFGSVIAIVASNESLQVVEAPRHHLSIEAVGGLDPRLGVSRVTGEASGYHCLLDGPAGEHWWSERVASGRRALVFGLAGAMEAMLGLAVTHASERHQFNRPIGTFQAVRHRLAESFVALEATRAAAEAAFDEEEWELSAMTAKVVAGRAHKLVATHCQQVLAGVGYTAEHPFHTYFARATALDRLLGSGVELAPELGRMLLRRGHAVRLANL
jgi:hypothetical protein